MGKVEGETSAKLDSNCSYQQLNHSGVHLGCCLLCIFTILGVVVCCYLSQGGI